MGQCVTFALKQFTLSIYLPELVFQRPCIKYNHLPQKLRRLYWWKSDNLAWAGSGSYEESNFYIVAPMVQCFGPVTTPLLIIHQCFSHCWQMLAHCGGFSCFHSVHSERRLRLSWGWEGAQPEWLTQTDPCRIPCHVMLCNKISRKRGRTRDGGYDFCLPKSAL